VTIQVQFAEVDRSSLLSYGLLLPNSFPLTYLGNGTGATMQVLSRIFFGQPMFGLGIADAGLFATMTKSTAKNLLTAEVRSLDGATATFHVGDKYPIATAGFFGSSLVPPTFNFEDLGLLLKITPHVHGPDEVSLDVTAEFKLLAGQSVNGIPVISNRKLESKVRLRNGEWALVAGLMTTSEARTISGLPGASNLPFLGPLLRENDQNSSSSDVVLLLKPMLLNLPASESVPQTLDVGSESRLRIPL
jgi:general secretion pathway protein D